MKKKVAPQRAEVAEKNILLNELLRGLRVSVVRFL
jgi:hypothetical protein